MQTPRTQHSPQPAAGMAFSGLAVLTLLNLLDGSSTIGRA